MNNFGPNVTNLFKDDLDVLFEKLIEAFGENQARLEEALNIMAVTLTPPDNETPLTIRRALEKYYTMDGSSVEDHQQEINRIHFTKEQKGAIQALLEFANTKKGKYDVNKAQALIERYSAGSGAVIPGQVERYPHEPAERRSSRQVRSRKNRKSRKSRRASRR